MTHRCAIILLFTLLLVARFATAAPGLFQHLATPPLPYAPGERSVSRLLLLGKTVYGIIALGGAKAYLFSVKGTITPLDALPGITVPPLDVLGNPARPWAWDPMRKRGYSLSETGVLLSYADDGKCTELGAVAGTRPFEATGYQVSRALALDATGVVYTAGDGGAIHAYTPGTNKLEKLSARVPAVRGREPWASLDAAVFGPDGLLYGGSFDGYLFTFNPKSNEVINLGKPFRAQRIQGLAFRKGKLYGIGGDEDGIPRTFNFDPRTRGFELGGPPASGFEPIGAMLADADGNIYFSTVGRLANLHIWAVE